MDCQVLCNLFQHCTNFQHKQPDYTCSLLDTNYRPECQLVGGPTFRPDGDNLLEKCLDAIHDGSNTCDDILPEKCKMDSSPEGDILPGEIDSPTTCSNLCSIEEFPFFVFTLEEDIYASASPPLTDPAAVWRLHQSLHW